MIKKNPPPGTSDIFSDEMNDWYDLENSAKYIFSLYGYGEIRTPVFEYTEVFKKGLGDETEVVKKEMYSFEDNGGRNFTLRPEGTAGVMRAMLGTDVMNGNEKRVYYIGPMFRGERPAAGRKRQFHQIGIENIGKKSPELDAENIAMLVDYLKEIGITGSEILINTRGNKEDRIPAEKALKNYFEKYINEMCEDCKHRLNTNIWRILDCKVEGCKKIVENSPDVVSYFSQETQDYFAKVCKTLDEFGINYKVEPRLVRGLDYYVHTVFELTHSALGGQNAIAGGGRYELYLGQKKKPVIGVGFAVGMERLLMVREALEVKSKIEDKPFVYIVSMGEVAKLANIKLAQELRCHNIATLTEYENKSMKAQMRAANRLNANHVVIRGDLEIEKNVVVYKNMETGEQEEVSQEELINILK